MTDLRGRSLPSPLRLLVALLVSVVAFTSGIGVAEAQNGVAAINSDSGPAVEAVGDISPGHVGSDGLLFDDGMSGCCVAPDSSSLPEIQLDSSRFPESAASSLRLVVRRR